MKKVVLEHLGEKDFHAAFGKYFKVGLVLLQGGDIRDRYRVDAFHHQHFFIGV